MNRRTSRIVRHLRMRQNPFFGTGSVLACRAVGVLLTQKHLEIDGSDPIYRGMESVFGKWVMDAGEWFECVGMFMLFLAAMDQTDFDRCLIELQAFA